MQRGKPSPEADKPRFVRIGKVGRPTTLDEATLERLMEAYYSRPYSFRQLADMFGVSRMTIWRAVQAFAGAVV